MPGHDVIVVGASAGGVEALSRLAAGLPADLPAAVFVVLHVPPHGVSVLPRILSRAGPLTAEHARHGEPIVPGRIYVAPPDSHLIVKPGVVHLARGPRENGHRPALDPLFRTAARAYGPRVVAGVLSGTLDDGTAGLHVVKRRGGVAVVQDPADALYDGMPRSALENVAVDHCLPLAELPALLARLAAEPVGDPDTGRGLTPEMEQEADMAELELEAMQRGKRPGAPSGFGCPDCGGVLFELHDGEMVRYRCRVGHAWSPDSLLARQTDGLEAALWTALRALEERAALGRRVMERARRRGHATVAANFQEQIHESEQHAALIRKVLLDRRANPSTESTRPPESGEAAAS
jgi:two-component system chemotaxis response regulator CheB